MGIHRAITIQRAFTFDAHLNGVDVAYWHAFKYPHATPAQQIEETKRGHGRLRLSAASNVGSPFGTHGGSRECNQNEGVEVERCGSEGAGAGEGEGEG